MAQIYTQTLSTLYIRLIVSLVGEECAEAGRIEIRHHVVLPSDLVLDDVVGLVAAGQDQHRLQTVVAAELHVRIRSGNFG